MKKTSQKFKIDEILKACALFALELQTALVFHANILVFSQSQARIFFFGVLYYAY